jgi:hypothetical protein
MILGSGLSVVKKTKPSNGVSEEATIYIVVREVSEELACKLRVD